MKVHSGLDNKINWKFFKNADDMINHRIEVYEEFIDDYKNGKGKTYIKTELPDLPFENNEFSLILCSHILFLYDDCLDYNFHLKSLKEMLRITSNEVRIYPLVRLRSQDEKSPFVGRIIEDLEGYADFKIQKISYKFRKGGNEMLKIKSILY